jgi:sporulation protein YlmC with PRC-barrel domain
MKTKLSPLLTGAVAFAALLAHNAAAQSSSRAVPASTPQATVSMDRLQIAPPEAMHHSVRKLSGQPVFGSSGEKLGTIKDFVIDKKSGQVVYAVVSSGGVLGAGDTLRLVPLDALQPAATGTNGFTIKVGRATWDRVPPLMSEAFDAGIVAVTETQRRELKTLFSGDGTQVVSTSEKADPEIVAMPRDRDAARAASPWIRASSLRDKDIVSAGRELAEIEDVAIDFTRGKAAALVEVEDDLLPDDTLAVVPLSDINLGTTGREKIETKLTGEDFARLSPKHATRSDEQLTPTGRTSAEQNPYSNVAPALESAARSARQALDQHDALARADIRVTPENGRLILRGRVPSEKIRDQAVDAVKQAASGIKLDNQLTIEPR